MSPTLYGIVAMLMWSFLSVLLVFTGSVPGLLLTSVTLFIGALVLLAQQLVTGEDALSYWKQPLKNYLFVIAGIGGYTGLIFVAFKMTSPFEANSLNYLWPVFLVMLTAFMNKQPLKVAHIVGITLGFVGMLRLFVPHHDIGFFSNFRTGHVMAIAAAMVWAVYSVMTKKFSFPPGFMVPVFFVSAALFFVLHIFLEEHVLPQGWEWLAVLLLGIFRISYSFWDYGMKHGNVVLLASLSYFIPLASTTFLLLFGFGPSDPMIAWGAALIITGCLIVNSEKIISRLKQFRDKP